MILFIDDCPRRAEMFRNAFGEAFAWCSNHNDAVMDIRFHDGEISTIYLDIDGVCGGYIADYAIHHKLQRSAKWIIHSSNMLLAPKVRDRLVEAGYDAELKSFEDIVG